MGVAQPHSQLYVRAKLGVAQPAICLAQPFICNGKVRVWYRWVYAWHNQLYVRAKLGVTQPAIYAWHNQEYVMAKLSSGTAGYMLGTAGYM